MSHQTIKIGPMQIMEMFAQLATLEAANEKLREERRWIPVVERLPEHEGDVVLVRVVGGKDTYCDVWTFYLNHHGWTDGTVSHWMPLPPPPVQVATEDYTKGAK